MNTNIDLDALKSQWQSLNTPRAGKLHDPDSSSYIPKRRFMTSQQRVERIVLRFTLISFAWVFLSLGFIKGGVIAPWLCVAMSLYFTIIGLSHCYVLRLVRKINFNTMSLLEALGHVCYLQRVRIYQKALGICLCIPLLSMILMDFAGRSQYMLAGGIAGCIFGLIIGLVIDRNVRHHISAMKRELSEEYALTV